MSKNIILVGSSSELAIEFHKEIKNDFKIHKISSKKDSNPDLLINNYIVEQEKIVEFISNFINPYIIFFNGYLKENRPYFSPSQKEIFETFNVNYQIPLLLTKQIKNHNLRAKYIYISSVASIKPREKNFIYGIAKHRLEKEISELDIDALFLKFGKIRTKMSEKHFDPPFTLDKISAAKLLINSVDKKGIVYPTLGLKLMAIFIMIFPVSILDFIEKVSLNKVYKKNR